MEPVANPSGTDVVRFGTDGWRGAIAREFTFENVGRVAEATAAFLVSDARKELAIYNEWGAPYRSAANGITVGYDTRFLSDQFALHFARIVLDRGVPVAISDRPIPTPALSYSVVDRAVSAGIMFTASHNPATDNGIKYKAEYGGSAPGELTSGVEARLPTRARLPAVPPSAIPRVDLRTPFLHRVREFLDPDRLRGAPLLVVVDSMYGSAQGYVAELLAEYGVEHLVIRGTRDVLFGGKKPEPLAENLVPLRAVIASRQKTHPRMIGVVTDGDGDRVSAMDEKGTFINAHRTFALILHYLLEVRGWRGAVVKSFNLTDMATAICESYGLEMIEVPIGFKNAVEHILQRDVLVAAEESGSIAIQGHIPERDGVLNSLLLAEIAASADGPISEEIRRLDDAFGPFAYHRRDITVPGRLEVVARLLADPPDRFAGRPVKAVETLDGLKLRFSKGWLLFRASGTEPILRLYSEMPTERDVWLMLDEAEKLARGDLTLW
ncbi:MAG: phosphoglucomutase/phosphomannomutase family protein [Candidatus Bipolaricaulota bacterium]|nr:MAG: phosphoglucomutase/phosphomannomutase family protein [Candidatus Bipolaricaulota bacterium]